MMACPVSNSKRCVWTWKKIKKKKPAGRNQDQQNKKYLEMH